MVKTINRNDLGIASISIIIDKNNFIHNNIPCRIENNGNGNIFYINNQIVEEEIYNAKYNYCINELLDFAKKYDYKQ